MLDVWPGSGDWTRLFSDIVGPDGRVYSFVPAELAHFKSDPVGQMRALAKEPGRQNVEVVSADLVSLPASTQSFDVVWMHLFYHDLHTATHADERRDTGRLSIEPFMSGSSPAGFTSSSIMLRPRVWRVMRSRCIGSILPLFARKWKPQDSCWMRKALC